MARLIVNPTSPSSRREVGLHRRPVSIGRDPSNDLVIADGWVSRRHAVVEWQGDWYRLRDCNSSNGSAVNGDRLTERRLCDGDLVAIGRARLLFREEAQDSPGAREAADEPVPGDGSATTGRQPCRPSAGSLTAQHASLVRVVALRRADYL